MRAPRTASHYHHNDHKHHGYCTSRIPSFLYTPPLADPSKHLPGTSKQDGQLNTQHGVSEAGRLYVQERVW